MAQTRNSPDLYVQYLEDRDDSEISFIQALPQTNTTAETSEFKKMLERNLQQTEEHIARLEQIWVHTP